jgi:hypothetical protein
MRGKRDPFRRDEEPMLVGIEMIGLARETRREVDDQRAARFALAGYLAQIPIRFSGLNTFALPGPSAGRRARGITPSASFRSNSLVAPHRGPTRSG